MSIRSHSLLVICIYALQPRKTPVFIELLHIGPQMKYTKAGEICYDNQLAQNNTSTACQVANNAYVSSTTPLYLPV